MHNFNLNPSICTYLSPAYVLGILEKLHIPSPLLDSNIQLRFPLRINAGEKAFFNFYPEISMRRAVECGLLTAEDFSKSIVAVSRLPQLVEEILKAGMFAHLHVDYFYIRQTESYKRKHFRHDVLIYDWEGSSGYFHGALYRRDGTYGGIQITRRQLTDAFQSKHGRGADCPAPRYRHDMLTALGAGIHADIYGKLDWEKIRIQISAYLNSCDMKSQNRAGAAYSIGDGGHSDSHAFGVSVYACIEEYLNNIRIGILPSCDMRITRLLWEHKKVMKQRLDRLVYEGVELNPSLVAVYAEIVGLAYFIHIKAHVSKRRNDWASLVRIIEDVKVLRAREIDLLERLIN